MRSLRTTLGLLVALAAPASAEPLTNVGEPTTYCPGACSAEDLALVARYDRTLAQCEAGNAKACFEVSTMRLGAPYCCPPSPGLDRVWALRTMKKACDLGHDEACRQFYRVLTPWTDNLAKDNAEKGCAAGLGYACHVLGSWPLSKDDSPEDRALQRRACELGDPNGCAMAYVDVACGVEKIEGVSPADGRAKLESSCNTYLSPKWERLRERGMGDLVEHLGCLWLADGLRYGWGGPTNWSKARWLEHYVCRESGSCEQVFPLGGLGMVAMAGEASALALGLVLGAWPASRRLLEEKFSSRQRRWLRYLGVATAALLGLQLAYCAWGMGAWLG